MVAIRWFAGGPTASGLQEAMTNGIRTDAERRF